MNLQFLFDFQDLQTPALNQHWASLILSTGDEELFAKHYDVAGRQTVTEFLAFDLRNPGSILACVYSARENARMIRDQISSEMWAAVNELHLHLKSSNTAAVWAAGPQEFFSRITNS